jgi:hypothetical protein
MTLFGNNYPEHNFDKSLRERTSTSPEGNLNLWFAMIAEGQLPTAPAINPAFGLVEILHQHRDLLIACS